MCKKYNLSKIFRILKFSKSKNKLKNLKCNLYTSFESKLEDQAKTNP